jgi:hypothetical protein
LIVAWLRDLTVAGPEDASVVRGHARDRDVSVHAK